MNKTLALLGMVLTLSLALAPFRAWAGEDYHDGDQQQQDTDDYAQGTAEAGADRFGSPRRR